MNKYRCTDYCDEYYGVLQMWLDAEEKIEELKATVAYQEDVINALRSRLPVEFLRLGDGSQLLRLGGFGFKFHGRRGGERGGEQGG